MTTKVGLHSNQPNSPSLLARILSPLTPFLITAQLLSVGLLPAILAQLKSLNPFKILNPWQWRDEILAAGMGSLLKMSDDNWKTVKKDLISKAEGRVLEVGAGSGLTTAYYDESKVTSLVCIEPFAPLRAQLNEALFSRGPSFASKSTIVPHGIHQRDLLKQFSITPGSFDTIVLVQVLCSIPNPHEHLSYLQSLLKPGGKLLLFEHVASTDSITKFFQTLWTPGWKFIAAGCCLNRPSGKWVEQIGGWEKVELLRPDNESRATMLPHDVGVYVKF